MKYWHWASQMVRLVGISGFLCVTFVYSYVGSAADFRGEHILLAQSVDTQPAAPNYPTEDTGATRGLFFATLIPTIASGLANTLINWFGQKVLTPSGQIQPEALVQQQSIAPTPETISRPPGFVPTPQGDLHAGIAYEVYVQRPDLQWAQVNTQTFIFATGQRFVVVYRPNLPGRVDVYNRNPRGQETAIDSTYISGGQLVTLGPYQFSEPKGDELLRIVLTPCLSPQAPAITRDIARVANGDASALPFRLSQCMSKTEAPPVGTRDIQKVSMDGGTAFALDRLSSSEQSTGNLAPRSLSIGLQHR